MFKQAEADISSSDKPGCFLNSKVNFVSMWWRFSATYSQTVDNTPPAKRLGDYECICKVKIIT